MVTMLVTVCQVDKPHSKVWVIFEMDNINDMDYMDIGWAPSDQEDFAKMTGFL